MSTPLGFARLTHACRIAGCRARPALHVAVAALAAAAGTAQAVGPDYVRDLGNLDIKQLMELEVDSVYAASRYVQKSSTAPSSVTVITAAEIEKFGWRTLGQVLNSVRGVYTANDRNYTYLGMRGFLRPNDYNTRVLVLIDGHRMNDNVYDLGAVGRENMVDVDLIDRVEVIRGPSSSLYGSSAFFGVVNVITKRGSRFDGLEASAEAGTYDAYNSRMTFGSTFDSGVEWLISASHYESAGPALYFPEFDQRSSDDPRARNDGFARGRDGERADTLSSTLTYADLTISAFVSDRHKEVPTASFDTVFNEREETHDFRSYLDVRYEHRTDAGLLLQVRGFLDDSHYDGFYPYDVTADGTPSDVLLRYVDKTVGSWAGVETQVTTNVGERHTVIVGGEYRDNLREFQEAYYDVESRVYDVHDDRASHARALFAQSESQLRSNLRLAAGIRYDQFGDSSDELNPRLALIYTPSDVGTLKVLYGEAFRAPNPYERYYYHAIQDGLPALVPETIRTTEVTFERKLARGYEAGISGYSYHVHNLISQLTTPEGDVYFANSEGANARGVELEVARRFESGAALRASYALQKTTDEATLHDLTNSPRRMGKLAWSLPLHGEALSAGLELDYHGSYTTLNGARADDFAVTNFTLLGRPAGTGFELSMSLYNVFDKHYGTPGSADHVQTLIPQNGRTVLGKLVYRFK